MNVLLLMLPGTPITYYGEEIGMMDYDAVVGPADDSYLHEHRDPCRTPMQWNPSPNAGFSREKPWLPVHPNYKNINVERQTKEANSSLNIYRTLSNLRRHGDRTILEGKLEFHPPKAHDVLCFLRRRHRNPNPSYFIVINFEEAALNLCDLLPKERSGFHLILRTAASENEHEIGSKEAMLFSWTDQK